MYDAVPPVGIAVADPSLFPVVGLIPEILPPKTLGSAILIETVAEVVPSVAVTVYVPAARPVMVALVPLLLQANVFVPVPPVALAVAPPFELPLQLVLLSKTEAHINRLFTISFPSQTHMEKFFSNADYVTVKEKYFDQSVKSKTIISLYEVDT